MPAKFNTITEEEMNAMSAQLKHAHINSAEWESLFDQFQMYQENRLKINKDSRESKMAQRKEGGGGEGRSKSAKMTGVVKLVPIEGQENTFKVEKVSAPVAPKPQSAEEEENLAENPEALAAAVAEAAARSAAAPKTLKVTPKPRGPAIAASQARMDAKKELEEAQRRDSKTGRTTAEVLRDAAALHPAKVAAKEQAEAWKKSEAERKKAEGIAKAKATRLAKKESIASAAKAALAVVVNDAEEEKEEEYDSDTTETDVESENDEE